MNESFSFYETGPIDHWVGWTPIEDYVGTIDKDDRDGRKHLFQFMFKALYFAREHSGWEGDIGEMYVSGLPPENHNPKCFLMIGWKQGNNGTSFIASEVELPYLEGAQVFPKPVVGVTKIR